MRAIDRNAHTNRWRPLPCGEKAALALGLMAVALATGSWCAEGLILLSAVGLTTLGARVPAIDMARSAAVPAGFILAGTLAQGISLRFGGGLPALALSAIGLSQAAFVGLRSLACVAALLGLALTTPLTDVLQLLRRLGVGREVCDVALVMFRFVWLILECAERGGQSQANRQGYDGYRRSLRSLAQLMASLLPRALGRARRLEGGLAARGYEGELRFVARSRPSSALRVAGFAGLIAAIAIVGRVAV
jgi:cobalt/nickel transport system permease protein